MESYGVNNIELIIYQSEKLVRNKQQNFEMVESSLDVEEEIFVLEFKRD